MENDIIHLFLKSPEFYRKKNSNNVKKIISQFSQRLSLTDHQ